MNQTLYAKDWDFIEVGVTLTATLTRDKPDTHDNWMSHPLSPFSLLTSYTGRPPPQAGGPTSEGMEQGNEVEPSRGWHSKDGLPRHAGHMFGNLGSLWEFLLSVNPGPPRFLPAILTGRRWHRCALTLDSPTLLPLFSFSLQHKSLEVCRLSALNTELGDHNLSTYPLFIYVVSSF